AWDLRDEADEGDRAGERRVTHAMTLKDNRVADFELLRDSGSEQEGLDAFGLGVDEGDALIREDGAGAELLAVHELSDVGLDVPVLGEARGEQGGLLLLEDLDDLAAHARAVVAVVDAEVTEVRIAVE